MSDAVDPTTRTTLAEILATRRAAVAELENRLEVLERGWAIWPPVTIFPESRSQQ